MVVRKQRLLYQISMINIKSHNPVQQQQILNIGGVKL